jgi:hypothetical protein
VYLCGHVLVCVGVCECVWLCVSVCVGVCECMYVSVVCVGVCGLYGCVWVWMCV